MRAEIPVQQIIATNLAICFDQCAVGCVTALLTLHDSGKLTPETLRETENQKNIKAAIHSAMIIKMRERLGLK